MTTKRLFRGAGVATVLVGLGSWLLSGIGSNVTPRDTAVASVAKDKTEQSPEGPATSLELKTEVAGKSNLSEKDLANPEISQIRQMLESQPRSRLSGEDLRDIAARIKDLIRSRGLVERANAGTADTDEARLLGYLLALDGLAQSEILDRTARELEGI